MAKDEEFAIYSCFIQSAMRSAIIIVVALALARMQLGMMDASTTSSRLPSLLFRCLRLVGHILQDVL